jgi:hypothetical protein
MKQETITIDTPEAIYRRPSVCSYSNQDLDRATILTLLAAAAQAPTAMHEEPWAFSVIQDQVMLSALLDAARTTRKTDGNISTFGEAPAEPENLFHDVGTLIVIWGKPMGPFVAADCWRAAENLMLAACSIGLSSWVVRSAAKTLNMAPWKADLNAPADWVPIAAIIICRALVPDFTSARKPPEILSWRTGDHGASSSPAPDRHSPSGSANEPQA